MLHKIFGNNLLEIRKNRVALKLDKPAHIGMCILEFSKVLIYKFHYDYIKNKYDNKSKLLFTDTNSLINEIKTEDVYEDFNRDKEIFDFSNYSTKSKYYDNSNKLVVGKMKDEREESLYLKCHFVFFDKLKYEIRSKALIFVLIL